VSDVDRSAIAAASASTAASPSSSASAAASPSASAAATSADTSADTSAKTSAENGAESSIAPADRPAASGHRFGPDLACSECGMQWEAHQREPAPCATDEPEDAFLRRPDASDLPE